MPQTLVRRYTANQARDDARAILAAVAAFTPLADQPVDYTLSLTGRIALFEANQPIAYWPVTR